MSLRAVDASIPTLPFQVIKATFKEKKSSSAEDSWMPLIPLITTVATGCLLSPIFAIGVRVGAIAFTATAITHIVLHSIGVLKEDGSSSYIKEALANPFDTGVIAPILEELLIRGGLQTGLVLLARNLLPLTLVASPLFSPIVLADLVAIMSASAIFGLLHADNDYPDAWFQVVFTTASGFVCGMLMNNYGIVAPIGAHITNNCLAWAGWKWIYSSSLVNILHNPNSLPLPLPLPLPLSE